MVANRVRKLLPCFMVLTLAVLAGASHAEGSVSGEMQRGVKAKPVVRKAPRYPRVELDKGRQGWVELSYVVTTDGNVIDPIVQDSSGSRSFERAALRTVEGWSYEPATWNGTPVQQCETKVMITFAIEGEGTKVSRPFYRQYKKIDKEMNDGDLEATKVMLDDALESFDMTLPELAWFWALRARYEGLVGNKDAQLAALRKATARGGDWVDDDLYPGLLLLRTIRELESGNYSAAIDSHEKLVGLKTDLPQAEQIRPHVENIQTLIASDEVYSVPAKISGDESCLDCVNNWHYRLLRRKFSLAVVNGQLGNLEIRCSRRRVVDTAREGVSWQIPDNWGDCSVVIFGDPGATFSLLEEPSAASSSG